MDTVGGCFVREIIGDPARADGRLRAKDQIVMVGIVLEYAWYKRDLKTVNIYNSLQFI